MQFRLPHYPVPPKIPAPRSYNLIAGGSEAIPCLGYGLFFLVVVVFVEIVDGLFCSFDDFLFLFRGNFFSALDLEISLFAPLSLSIEF
jgi:hypothetical protein